MKFRELFQDVEDWFWKLEFNTESMSYELYLGIPNDWVFAEKNGLIDINLIHQLKDNCIVKISSTDEDVTIDDIIDTAKGLITKNQELEKRKEEHRAEMENLKNMLIAKEKNFLEYIDTVKDNTLKSNDTVSDAITDAVITVVEKVLDTKDDGVSDGVNKGAIDGVNFLKDIENNHGK